MRRMLSRTWLATTLFVVSTYMIAGRVFGAPWAVVFAAVALLVVPVSWWKLVGRRTSTDIRRGVLAGALTGLGAAFLPIIGILLWVAGLDGRPHSHGDGFSALGNALVVLLGMAGAGLGAVAGGCIGAMVVAMERLRRRRPQA